MNRNWLLAGLILAIPAFGTVLFPSNRLTDSLVSWWDLEIASGTRIDKVRGSANNLTDVNTVTQGAGKVARGAVFTAANSETLSKTTFSGLTVSSNTATIACWYQPTTNFTGGKYIGEFVSNGIRLSMRQENGGGTIRFFHSSGNFGVATIALSLGTWYHLALVYNGAGATNADKLKGYINGSAVSLSFTGTVGTTIGGVASLNFHLGSFNGGSSFFDGMLDECGVWSRALSAGEIGQLYRGANPVPAPWIR